MRDGAGMPVARAAVPAGSLGRLTKRPQFLAAAKGRRFHTERVSVQGLLRPDAAADAGGGLRVGLTVTKRVGHATERNRIRRRLRAAAREAGLPFAALPLDVVLVGRREALSAAFPELVADLGRAIPAVARPAGPAGSPGQKGRRRGKGGKGADPSDQTGPEYPRDANRPHGTQPVPQRP